MLATWHWHIEVSSKCTLKCPRCARHEVPDTLVNTELDLAFFKRNFTPVFIKNNVEKITFCGDDGDPIYAHDLIEIIDYLKSVKNIEIVIITNGSYKSIDWWQKLGRSLTSKDSVHFSIDGFDHNSNNLYRINSNYASIINGIKSIREASDCQLIWAAIGFKFNEDHIENMKSQAKLLGIDRFQLTKSTKFGCVYPSYGNDDQLQPSKKLISGSFRFEREIVNFTSKTTVIPIINQTLYNSVYARNEDVVPLCEIGNKGTYIDAQGRLFPCCWVANRYSHNSEWQNIVKHFNLNDRTLEDALADPFWESDFRTYRWAECKTKCNRSVMDENYGTAW